MSFSGNIAWDGLAEPCAQSIREGVGLWSHTKWVGPTQSGIPCPLISLGNFLAPLLFSV